MPTLQQELARVLQRPEPTERQMRRAQRQRTADTPQEDRKIPYRKPKTKSHTQWAQHSVDMDSFYHRKRKAKRGDARTPAYGMAQSIASDVRDNQYLRGKGLRRKPGPYALYIEGKVRGWSHNINFALGYAIAAKDAGYDAQCIEV